MKLWPIRMGRRTSCKQIDLLGKHVLLVVAAAGAGATPAAAKGAAALHQGLLVLAPHGGDRGCLLNQLICYAVSQRRA